jgi:hypothetical protein
VALGLWNIQLQIGRPELEPYDAGLIPTPQERGVNVPPIPPGWNGYVMWQNYGKKSARSPFSTVYAAEKDGRRQSKLWAGPSATVMPNARGSTGFPLGVLNDLPDHLLICVAYVNESMKKYRQAFRYHVLRAEAQLKEELPRPSGKTCR